MVTQLIHLYNQFLDLFPHGWHGPISLLLALAIAGGIWHAIRQSGIWLLILVILIPALIPVVRDIGQAIIEILKFLLQNASGSL